MPAKPKKARNDFSYDGFRAKWERAKPFRRVREQGRGKPGDVNYRPAVMGSRPHKVSAAAFLDELLWLGSFVGDDLFNQAHAAALASGAIKDRKWVKDFHASSPGYTPDPFVSCVRHVEQMTVIFGSERLALAWAVATFDLPAKTFDAAVARMRKALRTVGKAKAKA